MFFNFALLLVDFIALGIIFRYRTLGRTLAAIAMVAVAGIGLGAFLAKDSFHFARMAAYGIFLHAPFLLCGTATLWWKRRKMLSFGAMVAALLLLAVGGYVTKIEPYWLEVTHYEIRSPKIERAIRLVAIADLQTACFGEYERQAIAAALAEKPDYILFAGDYLQTPYENHSEEIRKINAFLREMDLSALRGAFAVQGNVDAGDWPRLFEGLNVAAVSAHRHFDLDDLQITCLGLGESFDTQLEVDNPDRRKFHLVLGHAPNFARGKIDADLLVAGHTHGGQVRIPFFGAIITNADIPRRWASGMNDLPSGGKLLVPRGIGAERGRAPQLRFLCRPELAVIDLKPEK
jgi:uncharacterized protein